MAVEVINTRYEVQENYPSSDTSPFVCYKALDIRENRVVTLKVLPARTASRDPRLLNRLRSVIAALPDLDSPLICRIHDVDILENGDVFLVSDYIRGITLKERIRRVAPFSLGVAADIAVMIAEALTVAHRAGVVHGRLMPSHISQTPEGQVCVSDFRIARIVDTLLPESAVLSAPYLPADYNHAVEPDPIQDVHALGAILYEMLTGVVPRANPSGVLPGPAQINSGIPPALDGIAMKALHPDAHVRYRDISAMLTDLRAARAGLRAGRALSWSPMAESGAAQQSASDQDQEPENEPLNRSGNRRHHQPAGPLDYAVRILLVIAVCAMVAVGYLIYTQFFEIPSDVTVPSLIGLTVDEARRKAAQIG
ncbi:MAG: protein kinase domain-containing protein, partial [Capsulimonadaceae bacterium]